MSSHQLSVDIVVTWYVFTVICPTQQSTHSHRGYTNQTTSLAGDVHLANYRSLSLIGYLDISISIRLQFLRFIQRDFHKFELTVTKIGPHSCDEKYQRNVEGRGPCTSGPSKKVKSSRFCYHAYYPRMIRATHLDNKYLSEASNTLLLSTNLQRHCIRIEGQLKVTGNHVCQTSGNIVQTVRHYCYNNINRN